MRIFALVMILLCTLVTPIIGQTITVTPGPALQPLPKFVQELADDDFQVWTDWQNRQATARAAERGLPDLPELPWRRVIRETTASGATHVSSDIVVSSATRLQSGRSGNRGRGGKSGGNSQTYRAGYAAAGSVRELGPAYYPNPNYTGPGPLTVYNPYCRSAGGIGSPDWDNLFIPTQDGKTRTLGEELQKRGPVDPEALYRELFTPYYY